MARLAFIAEVYASPNAPGLRLPGAWTTVSMANAKFNARFPGFAAWLAASAAALAAQHPPLLFTPRAARGAGGRRRGDGA